MVIMCLPPSSCTFVSVVLKLLSVVQGSVSVGLCLWEGETVTVTSEGACFDVGVLIAPPDGHHVWLHPSLSFL